MALLPTPYFLLPTSYFLLPRPTHNKGHSKSYFGNGETFVFKLHPSFARFNWTRTNSHFVHVATDCLAFGAAPPALYLDQSLEYGSTGPSPTFANESLTAGLTCGSDLADFKIIKVEVWGFV